MDLYMFSWQIMAVQHFSHFVTHSVKRLKKFSAWKKKELSVMAKAGLVMFLARGIFMPQWGQKAWPLVQGHSNLCFSKSLLTHTKSHLAHNFAFCDKNVLKPCKVVHHIKTCKNCDLGSKFKVTVNFFFQNPKSRSKQTSLWVLRGWANRSINVLYICLLFTGETQRCSATL